MKTKFEKLYDAYYDSLYRYIYVCVKNKWNAEDIISTVFTKIYENKEKIQDVETSKNWVFKIAHNAIIDFYRKNGRVIPIDEFIDAASEDDSFQNILIKDEFSKVKKIIEGLPPETKNIIYLRFYGGLKFREIAEIVNKTENTVKSIVNRAMKKVRISYEESLGGKVYERK